MGTSLLFHGPETVLFDGVFQTFHVFPNLFAGPAPGRRHTRSKFRDSPVIVRSAARLRVMNSAPSRREAAGEVHDAAENAGGSTTVNLYAHVMEETSLRSAAVLSGISGKRT